MQRVRTVAHYDDACVTVLRLKFRDGFSFTVVEQELEALLDTGHEDAEVYQAVRKRAARLLARLWFDGLIVIEERAIDLLDHFHFTNDEKENERLRLSRTDPVRPAPLPAAAFAATVAEGVLAKAMRKEQRWRRRLR